MSKLDDELAKDESLWRMWQEDGVTESTPLAVDVFFYATRKDAAHQIAGALRQWGLTKVEVKTTRTLWVFKGWEITGVEDGTWSLGKLQDRSRRYLGLAEIWSATYDGCGALIDPGEDESRQRPKLALAGASRLSVVEPAPLPPFARICRKPRR